MAATYNRRMLQGLPDRPLRRVTTTLLCAAACLALSGCEPAGRAVGDTQDVNPEVAHIGKIKTDMLVGLIGGANGGDVDRMILSALDAAQVNAVYSSTDEASDPDTAAVQAVGDMIRRRATIIVIDEADPQGGNEAGWDDVLRQARALGLPVTFLNPVSVPDDETLFAAVLTVNDRASDAQPIARVLADIMDDKPHERSIMVSTTVAEELNRP